MTLMMVRGELWQMYCHSSVQAYRFYDGEPAPKLQIISGTGDSIVWCRCLSGSSSTTRALASLDHDLKKAAKPAGVGPPMIA
jgi:hypothetical protein